jgi:TetR/AcrR family transcriptional regulator, transcriptional repressor for nem operon
MSKASETRSRIISQSAELFNQKGFAGVSMADILAATGLQKGGIYNHFQGKEEIAIASFDYAVDILQRRHRSILRQHHNSVDRILAFIDSFCQFHAQPPFAGGCPIMNVAIEQDSHQSILRDRAIAAMDSWRSFFCKIIARGIDRHEIAADTDADAVATIMISTLEGGLMLTQLYNDRLYINRSAEFISRYIQQLRV